MASFQVERTALQDELEKKLKQIERLKKNRAYMEDILGGYVLGGTTAAGGSGTGKIVVEDRLPLQNMMSTLEDGSVKKSKSRGNNTHHHYLIELANNLKETPAVAMPIKLTPIKSQLEIVSNCSLVVCDVA